MTVRKRWHRSSFLLAAVLVGLTVLFPTLGALDRLFSAGVEAPTSLLPARPFDADGLAMEGTILSVNPVAGSMELRLAFLPTGTLGRAGVPTRDITVLLSDGAGRNVLRFRAGEPMDLARISLVLPRTPIVRYPFDHYATAMLVGAVQHVGAESTPLLLNLQLHEEVSGWEFTAEPDDARAEALAGRAEELAGVPLKPAVGRIEIRRSGEVIGYALGLAVLMLGLAVGTLFLLWNFVVEHRPLEAWFATYGVGVVFSLPRLRDSLPNAPPLGTAYDYLVYYWALAVTAIALLLIIGTWFARAQRGFARAVVTQPDMVDFRRFKHSGRGGNQMNIEQARFNMVEQQIRPWEVLDQQVLDLLHEVRREEFVPQQFRALAFFDMEIPLGHGEVMLAPKIEARILQELAIRKTDRMLEVGTGSGYFTALLARLGAHVYSVDIVPEFVADARGKLAAHGVTNVTLQEGDGARGWGRHGPYDVIVLTGSVPTLASAFQTDLSPGGRLFAIIGDAPVMEATLITCVSGGVYNSVPVFETCVAPLRNAPTRLDSFSDMRQLTSDGLKSWLADGGRLAPLLLDVREPWEYQHCCIEGAQSMPMATVPTRLAELPKDREIVVICHHGGRSQQIAAFLEQAGFDRVHNLQGGVHAWALQVDPTMPRY